LARRAAVVRPRISALVLGEQVEETLDQHGLGAVAVAVGAPDHGAIAFDEALDHGGGTHVACDPVSLGDQRHACAGLGQVVERPEEGEPVCDVGGP
jgi:hypothetical protein